MVDVVFDFVFVVMIFKEKLVEVGVIFCLIFEVVYMYLELVKKYFGFVVLVIDNFYVILNFVVFSDGLFVYIFEGVWCLMELSIYFWINE